MKFGKGHQKLGGRGKNTPNKVNAPVKELLANYSQEHWQKFTGEINRLEGIDYVKSYLSLLEYITPKLQRITAPVEKEQPKEILFSFMESINVTDEVSTFSELPIDKQAELLKKAKIAVKPRPKRTYDRPQTEYTEPTRTEYSKYEPSRSEPKQKPEPQPEKKHEQMETINVSNFKYQDCIIR